MQIIPVWFRGTYLCHFVVVSLIVSCLRDKSIYPSSRASRPLPNRYTGQGSGTLPYSSSFSLVAVVDRQSLT